MEQRNVLQLQEIGSSKKIVQYAAFIGDRIAGLHNFV